MPSTLLRLAASAGPHLPASRPGRAPRTLAAGRRTPAFRARTRPGKGARLGWERKPCVPVQPSHRRPARAPALGATAPVPVGRGGEAAARAGAKRGLACSLPQPAVPEPGAALPKGPSSPPPPPPTLSERSARERRRPGRRSQAHNAFGSWGLSAARGGGGGAPGSRAPALASIQHRPSPGSRPPPAMARSIPPLPESQPARGVLGRDPAGR